VNNPTLPTAVADPTAPAAGHARAPEKPLPLRPWSSGSADGSGQFFDFAVGLPGSKSLTLRDCAIAALAHGESTIRFPGECDDYWRMKDCLRRLAIGVDDSEEGTVRIAGRGGEFGEGPLELFTGQSAVSTRLLLAMTALRPAPTTIDGHVSMRARPNKPLVDALIQLGADLRSTNDGYLPTLVQGSRDLRGPVEVPSDISSQYLTSLLIIAPLLCEGLTIKVAGKLTSKPYVDLTLDEMAKFGVQVDNHDYGELRIRPQPYQARTLGVEGDASAASYFAALATLHGGRVLLQNLGSQTRQGDYAFLQLCEQMGAVVKRSPDQTEIIGPNAPLRPFGADVDMTSMPDVAPSLMMIAPFLPSPTRITGLATLRVKECDRIAAPARELRKLGISLEEGPDYIRIDPIGAEARARKTPVEIETYHDHRIAMSFGVLGSKLEGLQILDPGCVAKTYPNYWKDWERARPKD
jgi:3-phosphoshikimate 1-carboxyvinyltransferase